MEVQNKNIYDSCKYFYCILKLLRLAPFIFDRKTKTFKNSVLSVMLFILSITICKVMLLEEYKTYHVATGIQGKVLDELWKHQYTLQHFLGFFVIIRNFLKKKNIENLLRLISNFDESIEKLQWNFKPKDKCISISVFVFFVAFLMMTVFSFTAIFYRDEQFDGGIQILMFTRMILFYRCVLSSVRKNLFLSENLHSIQFAKCFAGKQKRCYHNSQNEGSQRTSYH